MIVPKYWSVAMETLLSCGQIDSRVWGNAELAVLQSQESQQLEGGSKYFEPDKFY